MDLDQFAGETQPRRFTPRLSHSLPQSVILARAGDRDIRGNEANRCGGLRVFPRSAQVADRMLTGAGIGMSVNAPLPGRDV